MASNQVVLVTGANGALGSAVVKRFAQAGSRVVALERSKGGGLALEPNADGVFRLQADMSTAASLSAALEKAEAAAGPITGAVLTAGTWRGGHKFHEAAAQDDYRAVMDANLEATSVALRAVVPRLVTRSHGSVVLVGSRSGLRPYEAGGSAAYAASKAALTALAQTIAAEVLASGVRVNTILPATIDTEANRKAMPDADRSRWVSTDSLCDVIDFLLSERSRDVSGAAIPVYGRDGV